MARGSDFQSRYGPSAVVTGASSGIGEQIARLLAERGLDLVLVARRTERLEQLSRELREVSGVEVETLTLDLARPDFLAPLLGACAGRDVGLVVSNAGTGAKGLHHETPTETLDEILGVNCRAPLLLARAFVPRLLERGRGGFLITASIEGFLGFPYSASYAASKAFALSLAEGLWGELRGRGVDVLALAPGSTDTEMLPRSGVDPADMTGLMSPRTVARLALEHLGRGPVHVPGVGNRLFAGLLSRLPRRLGVTLAGKGMKAALDKGARSRAREREAAGPAR